MSLLQYIDFMLGVACIVFLGGAIVAGMLALEITSAILGITSFVCFVLLSAVTLELFFVFTYEDAYIFFVILLIVAGVRYKVFYYVAYAIILIIAAFIVALFTTAFKPSTYRAKPDTVRAMRQALRHCSNNVKQCSSNVKYTALHASPYGVSGYKATRRFVKRYLSPNVRYSVWRPLRSWARLVGDSYTSVKRNPHAALRGFYYGSMIARQFSIMGKARKGGH